MRTPTFVPKCPNHGEPLYDVPFPLPEKGTGICPVSNCPFDFTAEVEKDAVAVDKNGNLTKKVSWNVQGND
jgi:hypothetical protein